MGGLRGVAATGPGRLSMERKRLQTHAASQATLVRTPTLKTRCPFASLLPSQGNVAKGVGVYMGALCLLQGCASHGNGMKAAQVGDEGSRLLLGPGCTFDRQPVVVNGGTIAKV